MAHLKARNKQIGTVPENYKTAEILDKNFKTTVLRMFKELKEDMER